jgi:hypothetical protein
VRPGDEQRRADDASGFPAHIADENAERDRRVRDPLEEVAVDRGAPLASANSGTTT